MSQSNREIVQARLPELFGMLLTTVPVMMEKDAPTPVLSAIWLDQDGAIEDLGVFFAADSTSTEIESNLRMGLERGLPGSDLGPADVMACLVYAKGACADSGVLVSLRTQDMVIDQFVSHEIGSPAYPVADLDLRLARPNCRGQSGLPN